MSRNIFTNNISSSNNIFTNNSNQSQTNVFTRNQQNNNSSNNNIFTSQSNRNVSNTNIFNNQNNQANNQGNQGNNIFNNQSQGQNQNQNQGNIFTRGNNSQGNNSNIFNNNQGSNNIFSNNQGSSNIFNNNQTNQSNNIFNNQNTQGSNNIFNNNQQSNIFSQNNRQNTNIFSQNNQQNQGNNFQFNNPQLLFQEPLHYFLQFSPQQQSQLIRSLQPDEIRRFIQYCTKSLISPAKLEAIALSEQNTIRYEKVNKLAARLNIKNELLQIKKQVKDNVTAPISVLKRHNDAIAKASKQLSDKLFEKLIKQKEKLIQATTEQKMVIGIKQQVDEIDNHIKDVLKPLYNSCQGKSTFKFIDPDPFCIKISEQILKKITYLDNKMDELLACESQPCLDSINISNTIEQLIQYYENVAIALRQFAERYNRIKREALSKGRGNAQMRLDHIKKKSAQKIEKQLKAYTLLKQIESILQQRGKEKISH